MSDNALFLVFTNPVEGKEEEYNAWYDDVHLDDVLRVPGIVGAKRYELEPTGPTDAPPPAHRYLAVYEIDGEAEKIFGELVSRAGSPEMSMSDALDLASVSMAVWRPRG